LRLHDEHEDLDRERNNGKRQGNRRQGVRIFDRSDDGQSSNWTKADENCAKEDPANPYLKGNPPTLRQRWNFHGRGRVKPFFCSG